MIKEKSCGAIVYKSGMVLLIKHNMGHVSFPKGHVEKGETEKETACREVFEETAIRISVNDNFRYKVSYSPKKGVIKDVVYFSGTYVSGEVKPQLEEVSLAFFAPLDEALELITYDNDRDALRAFIEKEL